MAKNKKTISFNDYLMQLFGRDEGELAKTVTIQVTDACNLSCTYCPAPGTRLLTPEGTTILIENVKPGDYIIGFDEISPKHTQKRVYPTKVIETYKHQVNELYRLTMSDGKQIDITPEHRVLNGRNKWTEVRNLRETTSSIMSLGYIPRVEDAPDIYNIDYIRGYFTAMWMTDGSYKYYEHNNQYAMRLAVKDDEIIDRMTKYCEILNVDFYLKDFLISKKENLYKPALFSRKKENYYYIIDLVNDIPNNLNNCNYLKGFIAACYDAEGHIDKDIYTLSICNSNDTILDTWEYGLSIFGFEIIRDKGKIHTNLPVYRSRLVTANKHTGEEQVRFFTLFAPAVKRKSFQALENSCCLWRNYVKSIEHLTGDFTVYNIATESRTYIAEGLAVHNCYQVNKHNHFIPIETGKKFIDDLLTGKYDNYCDYAHCQGIVLEFIGGEPFMAIDQVSELTDYFIQRLAELNHKWLHRYKISICSNGVLYFDPKVQEYIAKHLNHLSFNISIDGNKELHDACRIFPDGKGSYDIAIAGVKDFRERYRGHMGSKMTIAPDNIMHTCQAVKDFIASGYDDINLNTVYEEGWTVEHAKILYDQLKQTADYLLESGHCEDTELSIFDERLFHPINPQENGVYCGGSGSMLAVDWKGDLYPCIRYMESSIGDELEPLIIGNVDTGMMATQKQCDKVDCLKCITRRSMSDDKCFYCPIGTGCGCCTAYNYQYYGDADKRTTFICIMHQARCLANAYYWNKYHILHGDNHRFKINIPDEWALEIIDENELAMLKFFESYTIE